MVYGIWVTRSSRRLCHRIFRGSRKVDRAVGFGPEMPTSLVRRDGWMEVRCVACAITRSDVESYSYHHVQYLLSR